MIGLTFGNLTVQKTAKHGRYWCKCSCGSKNRSSLTVQRKRLLSGETKHCTAKLHLRSGAKTTKEKT